MPPNTRAEQIGHHLRELREDRDLTLETLAARSGVAWRTIQGWEKGDREPQRLKLEKVAETLGVKVEDILYMRGGQNDPVRAAVDLELTINSMSRKLDRLVRKVSLLENRVDALERTKTPTHA